VLLFSDLVSTCSVDLVVSSLPLDKIIELNKSI
jgi:hypothetical protein